MNVLGEHRVFWGCLSGLFLVALVTAGFVLREWARWQASHIRLAGRQVEFDGLIRTPPAPTAANASRIENELARVESAVQARRALLCERASLVQLMKTPPPTDRTDALIDLTNFVEKSRVLAEAAGIAIKPSARLGFGAYANEGPAPATIGLVFRQRLILENLLGLLFSAAPRELLQVQRRRSPDSPGADAEGFTLDPRLSLGVPGLVDTLAFRVVFTGQTVVLRRFLNQLAESDLGFAVCSVEVEPASANRPPTPLGSSPATESKAARTPKASTGTIPLIADNLSRFSVTVECVLPVKTGADPTEAPVTR